MDAKANGGQKALLGPLNGHNGRGGLKNKNVSFMIPPA